MIDALKQALPYPIVLGAFLVVIIGYLWITKNLANNLLVEIIIIGIAYPCLTILLKKAMLSVIRRSMLEALSLEHDKQANQSLFSTLAQLVQIGITLPGFYAIGALTTPQGFFLAMATNFTTELIRRKVTRL